MKKILLVNPHETAQSGFSNPPLGLLYLAGTLRSSGFDVRIVDGCRDGEASIYKALEEFHPEVIGITCLTPGRHQALKIASEAKKRNPASLIVLGGSHPTIMFRQILDHYPFVDIVVRGEGEQTILELVEEKPLHDVQGLAFREQGTVIDNGVRRPVEKLDSLPFPAWDMVDLNRYPAIDKGVYHGIDLAKVPRVSVVYSRGCSGSCHFCSSWWIWKGWRCRSAVNMVDELEWLYREQNIRHFCFADDALTVDRTATISLCEEILRRDLKIVFHATTRSDCVDAEMLQNLKAAGCYKIAIGVETGSQILLDRMGKANDVSNAEHAIRLGKEAGLITTALMIVGNVGETEATISESLAFLERSQPDEVGTVGGLWILPGTRLHADCKRMEYIDDDFWLSNAPYKIYTREHSVEELAKFKNTLMQYKSIPRGIFMSSDANRHRAGESLLTKWNRYVDSTVNEYSATSRWQGVDELHRELFQYIPIQCKDILDLGCGDGWSTNELTQLGKNAVGITINPEEAEHARKTYGLNLHVQDMHDIQFPDQIFDCIYCRESFEHCVAPFIALCEMNRVLKADGYALINLPDTKWIREDSHFSVLTPAQMYEMFFKCRFKVVETGKTELGHYWYLVRKVAELDQPCPYPAPDPLSHDRETPDTQAIAEKASRPRIIGMLRIKNEAAWIAEVLEKAAPLVDGFVILDDGSTDETPVICQSHPKMIRYEWQGETETDEVRDKNRLLRWTLENNPDWVIALDGDEVLEDTAIRTIRDTIKKVSPEFTKLGISFLYMWDKNSAYRIDGHYREVRHPRIFRVSGLPVEPADLSFTPSRYGSNFHCGSVPANLPGETLYIDVRVKHYGYFNAQQRVSKKTFYEIRDPENAATGYYDHLTTTQNIKLRTYRERNFGEVLQFDGNAFKATNKLKIAGNPLWQSALFYSPDCQSHLDIGSNHGSTLKGLDPEKITSIEAYAPSSDLLKNLCHNVMQADAREMVPKLVSTGETFDRITLFDFIEHIPKSDGEALLTQLESLYPHEIILFVPLETENIVRSEAYKQFMQRQFSRIPTDQHQLQSHKARWTPEDFERRGYSVTVIEDFHMPGFHAFFAYKYSTLTLTDLMQRSITCFLESDDLVNKPATNNLPTVSNRSGDSIQMFGSVGETSHVHPPLLLTHPERIFLGNRIIIREGSRLEAISQYRGETYQSQICIGDGTQIELDVHIGAAQSVRIGEKVMIAGRVTILDHDHGYRNPLTAPIDQPLEVAAVTIEDGAWLGENSVVCKGVTVGRHAVVGANAVVTRDVPPWGVVAGIPARQIKFYNHATNKWETVKDAPAKKATIVMPVFNQVDYTRTCLDLLKANTPENSFDLIVVDNASDDETVSYLNHFNGTTQVIRNDTNLGFVEACNQGARAATTPYIVFLNNDTLPQKGWLEALIQTIEHHPKVGAVGSKLIYPDGSLQEAGAVVFTDGTANNFGRHDDPNKPLYNRMVEVDYCSGACLLVRKDLFDTLGGFDLRYAPAYYEETDLCFGLRRLGYKVIYQPTSEVIHVGSVTAGTNPNSGFRKYLIINRDKFKAKWKNELEKHEAPLKAGGTLFSSDRRFLGSRDLYSAEMNSDTGRLPFEKDTSAEEAFYLQSQKHISSGNIQEAINILEEGLKRFPNFAIAHNDLGALYYRHGLKTEALNQYKEAVVLDPENINYRKNLADMLTIETKDYESAVGHYLKIIATHPNDIETLLALGHICEQLDQIQDAIDFYRQIITLDPGHQNAQERLSNLENFFVKQQLSALRPNNSLADEINIEHERRIIIISHHMLCFDRGSADYRNHQILNQLSQDGWNILYLYQFEQIGASQYQEHYSDRIKFLQLSWDTSVYLRAIEDYAPDFVWITSLWTIPYAEFIRDLMTQIEESKSFHLLLDTMDFHAKKYERKYATSKKRDDFNKAEKFKAIEKIIYSLADRIITVTTDDADDIKAAFPESSPIDIIPNIHHVSNKPAPLDHRRHICFLGNFNVNHNLDAARHFTFNILPLIRSRKPEVEFHLIGIESDSLTDLTNCDGVRLIGRVSDLQSTLDHYRVFACPMTYGAGMKGKIGMAMASGLPIVSTAIGMEGFPVRNGHDCFITDNSEGFATKCLALLENDDIWRTFYSAGRQIIHKSFSQTHLSDRLKDVLGSAIGPIKTKMAPPFPPSNREDIILNYQELLADLSDSTPEKLERSIHCFLSSYPECAVAHNDLAIISMNNGHNDVARDHYNAALDLDPENPTFMKNQADFEYFIDGAPKVALEKYSCLHARFPKDTEVLFGLGRIYQDIGQYELALHLFKQLLTIDPDYANAGTILETLESQIKNNYNSTHLSTHSIPPQKNNITDAIAYSEGECDITRVSANAPPRVSIVIPTYNRSKLLEEALESALKQTCPADEIIVVDDASTDDTASVVKRIGKDRVRYIHKKHSGGPATRNRGIAEARGDYILWLDDDDILMPDALKSHITILSENPEIDVVYGVLQQFDDLSGNNLIQFDPKDWSVFPDMMLAAMMAGCAIPNPGTIIRRSAYDQIGGYDISFARAHDYEFWSRSLTQLKFKKNDDIVCRYRIHTDNMSAGGFIDRSFESQIIRKMIHRYGMKKIYHWLNWEEAETATVVALYMASENFINLGDTYNALRLIAEIPVHLHSADICDLRLRALLYQGKTKEAWGILNSLSANSTMNANQLMVLRTNFEDHINYHKTLNVSFSKQDFRTSQKMLQILDDEGRLIPANQIIAFCAQHRNTMSEKMRLKVLQTAITQNPTCEKMRKRAVGLVSTKEARDALDATCRRVLDPVAESQIENTTPAKAEGLRAQNANGFSKRPIQQDEKASNLCQDACRFYENEDYHAAFESLGQATALQPDHWEAYGLLVNVMLQSGQEATISDQLCSLEERSDLPARVLAMIGNGYEAGDRLERAEGFATKALAQEPDCSCAWNLKGVIAYRRCDLEAASNNFKKAADLDDQWGEPWTNLGNIQWEQGFQEKALACFEKGFQLSPTAPNVITTYHVAVSETGRFEHARPIFETVVEAHPGFRKARFLLIDILIRIEAYQEALNQIEAVLVRFGADSQFLGAAKAIRAKIGPMTVDNKKHPSLSLCMIVKNEEQYLARCLESLKPIVDEMIIVDTGSNDNTRDIANVFGARVFDFEWNDDFSAARNFSLEQASGDWILVMDADEVIAAKDHKNIRKRLDNAKSNRQAFMVLTRNYTNQYNIIGWKPNAGQFPDEEEGTGWIPSEKVRIFTNHEDIRFEYPVHEVVGPALSRIGIPVKSFPYPVHHYGKMDRNNDRQKDERYYKIGMDKLSVSSNDPVAIREMAVQAAKLDKNEDSISLWKRFIELQPDDPRSYINLASCYGKLKQYQKARDAAQIAIRLAPDVKEAHLNLGLSELHLGKASKAKGIFQRLVKKDKNYHSALFLLGAAQLCHGDIDKGIKSLRSLSGLTIWDNLPYSIQELVESLMAANWPELVLNLVNGAKILNCSNEKIQEYGRRLEVKPTDQGSGMVASAILINNTTKDNTISSNAL